MQQKKAREKAEAQLLRAYAYFELVKVFGPVPLIDRTVTSLEVLNYPRVNIETVYDFIINDLKNAADVLPYQYTTAGDKGRVPN